MNKLIVMAPKVIAEDEIEFELGVIKSTQSRLEAFRLANELATSLRISGKLDRAISLLEEMLLRPDYDILYDVMAMSKFKLAVYHSESGRIESAKNLFTELSEQEPQFEKDLISTYTVLHSCNRLATIFHDNGEYEKSKSLSITEHKLAESFGDPFMFVRACLNVANDCRLLGQREESIDWLSLGLMNIRDAIFVPRHQSVNPAGLSLMEISKNLAIELGLEERWESVMKTIFPSTNI